MLLEGGAAHVTAVEPSAAIEVLRANTQHYGSRVTCVHAPGEAIPANQFDLVVSIGVLHHIPDPRPVVDAARRALRPGGQILIWLYGKEGNSLYRGIFEPARKITRRLPLSINRQIANALYPAVLCYSTMTRRVPSLPLARYLSEVWSKFDTATRKLAIIDQINPQWARYYGRDQAEAMLTDAGFHHVQSHHRHGYSWTVIGSRPFEEG
jgi:SAM-dependent methyltransferase